MVSLLRFKHGGARQTGVAVAAALRRMHASSAWPTWLGDPLSDPDQAPGWGGVAATSGEARGGRGGGEAGDGAAAGRDDGGSDDRGDGEGPSGDGAGGSGGGDSGGRGEAAGGLVAGEGDVDGAGVERARKRRRLTRERGRRGGVQEAETQNERLKGAHERQ